MSKPDGGPAFPMPGEPYSGVDYPGMTLRDYFAAAALTGLSADSRASLNAWESAAWAYQRADAMLKERAK